MAGKNEVVEGNPFAGAVNREVGEVRKSGLREDSETQLERTQRAERESLQDQKYRKEQRLKDDEDPDAQRRREEEGLTSEHREFLALIRGLSATIAGMQLRPEDTRKFNEALEKLKEKSGHAKEGRWNRS